MPIEVVKKVADLEEKKKVEAPPEGLYDKPAPKLEDVVTSAVPETKPKLQGVPDAVEVPASVDSTAKAPGTVPGDTPISNEFSFLSKVKSVEAPAGAEVSQKPQLPPAVSVPMSEPEVGPAAVTVDPATQHSVGVSAFISNQQSNSFEQVDSEFVGNFPVPKNPNHVAQVSYSMGGTINTGNYNNVKFQVSITIPCDLDNVEGTYKQAVEWVDKKSTELYNEVQSDIGKY